MQTNFTSQQRADPDLAAPEGAIRNCVHCGFCTATCPTYVLLGDERDSPRGRIYLIKEMLERGGTPGAATVKHVDRCLSCLACTTTCPSGVDYMHLIDHARAHIARNYRRPLRDRMLRRLLATILPYPARFRAALRLARLGRPFAGMVAGVRPLAAMLALAPRTVAPPVAAIDSPVAHAKGRVALLQGCAEPVVRPEYRAAATRLLNRAGYDVIFAAGERCCGALVHHMGDDARALDAARRNVDAWTREIEGAGLAAIVVTASGCGTTIKDYGFLLRGDPRYADKAARVSALARDVSELLVGADLPPAAPRGLSVAYHAACSLQHGQKIVDAPRRLLEAAGYTVRTPAEAHLCCGSAGVYNILQPEIAGRLGARKAAHLDALDADIIATGNAGCAIQIGARTGTPVVHLVELLDWATGGPTPAGLSRFAS